MNLPYDNKTMIAYLNEGKCPFCEQEGFKKIGKHINTHGLSMKELKDLLLLNRSKGFCSSDVRKSHQENGKRNSLKFKDKLRVGSDMVRKNLTISGFDSVSIEKRRLNASRIEQKERMSKLAKDPKVAIKRGENLKIRLSKDSPSDKIMKSIPITKKHYGEKNGRPDEFYAKLASEFIDQINKYGGNEVYKRMAEVMSLSDEGVRYRIVIARKRNLILLTGKRKSLRGTLTEKAKRILGT